MAQPANSKEVRNVVDIQTDDSTERFPHSYYVNRDGGPDYLVSEGSLGFLLKDLPRAVRGDIESQDDTLSILLDHISGIVEVDNDRALEFLRQIQSRYGTLIVSVELMGKDRIDYHQQSVPLNMATHGKTLMYAYFAGHAFENGEIARVFDVSKSTVRVNLSKFKNG